MAGSLAPLLAMLAAATPEIAGGAAAAGAGAAGTAAGASGMGLGSLLGAGAAGLAGASALKNLLSGRGPGAPGTIPPRIGGQIPPPFQPSALAQMQPPSTPGIGTSGNDELLQRLLAQLMARGSG